MPATGGIVPVLECMFDQHTLALVRRELGRYGRAVGLNDRLLSNLVLAVNEITTNAVRHAGGEGRLRMWQDRHTLWCVIEDRGPGISQEHLERSYRRRPGYIGGHGLWLTRHICDEIDIRTSRYAGTRVTLRYDLPTAST
ncbi:ATP-binding protein [Actinoplanes sp. NPDC049681]|uniref:ATP-binding protein n=1 Tax=Actinoplanes sp. NPDC049681 TaxID=3363905 RepID=UPI0037B1E763